MRGVCLFYKNLNVFNKNRLTFNNMQVYNKNQNK